MTGSSVAGFPDLGRTLVMGVVNVTPDSFSDGGAHDTVDAAVAHGLGMVAAGAGTVEQVMTAPRVTAEIAPDAGLRDAFAAAHRAYRAAYPAIRAIQ